MKNIFNLATIKWLSIAISLAPIVIKCVPIFIGLSHPHKFLSDLYMVLIFFLLDLLFKLLPNLLLIFFSVITQKIVVATKLLICSIVNIIAEFYILYWLPHTMITNVSPATFYIRLLPSPVLLMIILVLYSLMTVIFRFSKTRRSEK